MTFYNLSKRSTPFKVSFYNSPISNYHVVKDETKVRLLTGAGLIDAKVVQVDAANDLALLKADGRFAPLPIVPTVTNEKFQLDQIFTGRLFHIVLGSEPSTMNPIWLPTNSISHLNAASVNP
jgi:hypothetical protein